MTKQRHVFNDVHKGWPVPSTINPEERLYVCLSVPNDPTHISNFLGAMFELMRWTNYRRTNDTRGKQTADVWRTIWEAIEFSLEDCNDMCCDDQTNLMRQLLAAQQTALAYQWELADDGTPGSFAPGAPETFTGNEGQSGSEAQRREAALCRAIERFMSQCIRAVHDFLTAAEVIGGALSSAVTYFNPVAGYIMAFFVTAGASTFQAMAADEEAQRKVRCCIYDALYGSEITFENFKNAAIGCSDGENLNVAYLADQVMRAQMSTESNYRAFVRILNEEHAATSEEDTAADCECEESCTLEVIAGWDGGVGAYGESLGTRRWLFHSGAKGNGEHALAVLSSDACCFCVKEVIYSQPTGYRQTQVQACSGSVLGVMATVGACINIFSLIHFTSAFTVEIEICDMQCTGDGDCTDCS